MIALTIAFAIVGVISIIPKEPQPVAKTKIEKITITIDCTTEIDFAVVAKLLDVGIGNYGCWIASAKTTEQAKQIYNYLLGRNNNFADLAMKKWRETSKGRLSKINDCKSAKNAAKVVEESFREQTLIKVVTFCDGTRLLGDPAKKSGKR